MDQADLEQQVDKLSARIAHLEDELETSYMEEQFERRIDHIAPDDADVEISSGVYGRHARVTAITGDEAQMMIDSVDMRDGLDCALTETGDGLGMEIFTEDRNL